MKLGLANSVVAVTGGGSGIGAGISRTLVAEGATVVVLSWASEDVRVFLEAMQGQTDSVRFLETDLGDTEQCRRAIGSIERDYGRLDGLVNNAGANDGISLQSGSPELFMQSLRQNLLHYYSLAQLSLPLLKASRGSIVNISSKVAVTGQGSTSAYAAAKGAQLALTREWAVELLPFGIRVNAVVPAEVMTPLYQRWLDLQSDRDDVLRRIESKIPFGHRTTTPEEIGAAVAFLLSPTQSGHTTGQHVFVDGGYTHLDRSIT